MGDDIPPPKRGRRRAIAAESYDPTVNDNMEASIVFHPKTEGQLKCLQEAARDIVFFSNCDAEQQKILYNAMFERRVVRDEVIIRQGEDGDNFYVIEKGVYDIFVNDGKKEKRVVTLKDKGYFGELALLYNCPRGATIIAKTRGTLWGLDQKTFREIVVKGTARKRQRFEDLLKGVSILESLTTLELMNLTDALAEVTFSKNERIVTEGEKATKMYFIMDGEVSIQVKDKNDNNNEKEIVKLSCGQYFGELALVLNKPRVASVYSVTDKMKCAVLDIYAFERLLGPCVDIMKRNIEGYEEQRKQLGINSIASEINDCLSNNLEDVSIH